jgi:TonB family protein
LEFKFDIRILAISLLFHFSAFALLSFYTSKKTPQADTIEVVIKDARDEKIFLPSKKLKEKTEETKNSRFFSDSPQNFKKETVAEELGNFKNQNKQVAQNTEKSIKTESTVGPNFMPMANQKSELEERQSTINFQVPNLAKGEMTFLNSDFSTYASFYNRITPKIVYTWGNNIDDIALFPHMREKLRTKIRWTTRVELILNRSGHFQNLIIINSSGSDELDQAVVDALKTAAPYLNPPTGMIEKDGTVHITGEFAVYTQRPHYANPY